MFEDQWIRETVVKHPLVSIPLFLPLHCYQHGAGMGPACTEATVGLKLLFQLEVEHHQGL